MRTPQFATSVDINYVIVLLVAAPMFMCGTWALQAREGISNWGRLGDSSDIDKNTKAKIEAFILVEHKWNREDYIIRLLDTSKIDEHLNASVVVLHRDDEEAWSDWRSSIVYLGKYWSRALNRKFKSIFLTISESTVSARAPPIHVRWFLEAVFWKTRPLGRSFDELPLTPWIIAAAENYIRTRTLWKRSDYFLVVGMIDNLDRPNRHVVAYHKETYNRNWPYARNYEKIVDLLIDGKTLQVLSASGSHVGWPRAR